jgi:hypothetical protein
LDIYEQLQPKLTREELVKLEEHLVSAEKNAPLHPHPSGASSEWPAKLMHPVTGALDRMGAKMSGMMHHGSGTNVDTKPGVTTTTNIGGQPAVMNQPLPTQ